MRSHTLCAVSILLAAAAIVGCAHDQPKVRAELNRDASPVGNLPANPLQWKIVSSSIDTNRSTMSTLYGNDIAVVYARSHAERDYPSGAILSLVTWTQKEDSRWFGAWIPNHVQSIEFVFVTAAPDGHRQYSYQQFTGSPLTKSSSDDNTSTPTPRAAWLLSQRAAVLP